MYIVRARGHVHHHRVVLLAPRFEPHVHTRGLRDRKAHGPAVGKDYPRRVCGERQLDVRIQHVAFLAARHKDGLPRHGRHGRVDEEIVSLLAAG